MIKKINNDIEILLLELKLKKAIYQKEKLDKKIDIDYIITRLELILNNYNFHIDNKEN